ISHAEVNVELLIDEKRRLIEIERVAAETDRALDHGKDMVIFTSRQRVVSNDAKSSLSIGQKISEGLIAILDKITAKPRYILAKGGITSSDVATQGLKVKRAMVYGQIMPGVPVWKLGAESRLPALAYIVFPGNVGDSQALAAVVNKLKPIKKS
ncbi:MAG: hydroxyacid dehydrogenase, partial [Deltaproteobacteria bacterium]|nr:hydroxyacid dehydrogenase [Deltaproteobacteria bacterium]